MTDKETTFTKSLPRNAPEKGVQSLSRNISFAFARNHLVGLLCRAPSSSLGKRKRGAPASRSNDNLALLVETVHAKQRLGIIREGQTSQGLGQCSKQEGHVEKFTKHLKEGPDHDVTKSLPLVPHVSNFSSLQNIRPNR